MRKGTKILLMIITIALELFVIYPVWLMILLHIAPVQNFVADTAAGFASDKLGTEVRVGKISVGVFCKVAVNDFYVEDFQRDTLMFVGHLEGYLNPFGRGLSFARAEMHDAKLYLKETPEGVMNIKQVVDKLSNPNKKKKKPFHLELGRAAIKNMNLRIERLKHRDPEYGVDYGDMDIDKMYGFVESFTMDGPEIRCRIETFRATEKSGFRLNHLSGEFFLKGGLIDFKQARMATDRSYIALPSLHIEGENWQKYSDFIHNVTIDAELRNSFISSYDVGFFAPRLRAWDITVGDVSGSFSGRVNHFNLVLDDVLVNGSSRLSAEGVLMGLPDIQKTSFDLQISNLQTTLDAAEILAEHITGKELPANICRMLENSGRITLSGLYNGSFSSFKTRMNLRSAIGGFKGDLTLRPKGNLRAVSGRVVADEISLGDILHKKPLLGTTSFTARIDGEFGAETANADIDADVSKLVFKGYAYDSLRFKGRIHDRQFNGRITARDKHLNLDFDGLIDYNHDIPHYDFEMELHHAHLTELHINRRDSLSRFAGHIEARGSGRSIDDINGRVLLTHARYAYNDRTLSADSVLIRGRNSHENKFVELHSDFLNATFRSKVSYQTIFKYLKRSIRKYAPMLTRTDADSLEFRRVIDSIPDNESMLDIEVKNFNPVADALLPGLKISEGSSLKLRFNPVRNRLSFNAKTDYVENDKFTILRMNMRASNRGDSLSVYSNFEDLYLGEMLHLPNLAFNGGAKDGTLQVVAGVNDQSRKLSARFGARASLTRETGKNGRAIDIRLLPSRFMLDKMSWEIYAHNILIDTARTHINNLYIMDDDQYLWLDGMVSSDPADSLTVKLRHFELAPLSEIINLLGYKISGETNGQATVKGLLGGGEVTADIRVDNIAVNGMAGPPLRLTSKWDIRQNHAGFLVTNPLKQDTLVRGTYQPDKVRYAARITIDSLGLGLLNPLLTGVISDTRGNAHVDLKLEGERRQAELSGRLDVSGLQTTVDYTQVTYRVPSATMLVKGNEFSAHDVPVFDEEKNRGMMDFTLNLNHLSNISYDLRMQPQKMMVLNTTSEDNDYFYGKVYASGSARIAGHKGEVDMNISATSDDNSTFFMPLTSKSNISNANFVTFKKPVLIDTVDQIQRKRQALERRRTKKESAVNRMNINMALNIRPNVEAELTLLENTLKGRGQGTFNIEINPSMNIFNMYGDYRITDGSFILSLRNVLTRKFIVNPGSTIRWTGSPLKADMDITALYKLKASLAPLLGNNVDKQSGDRSVPVECIINLQDWLTQPDISFDVHVPATDPETQALIQSQLNTPEMKNKQFLSLLLFRSFMADNNSSQQENLGNSMSYNTGLEFLTNQLNNWLSSTGYDIFINYKSKSEVTNDELDFGLSKSLINDRLLVEVEGNYMMDNKNAVNNSMSNFMGEAYITYLIDRQGALKLKAFTQTIDRFDENQGLQETGIGIYFKEDFDNFRDFRRRIKERFTNKKRKARRVARRKTREEERQRRKGKGEIYIEPEKDGLPKPTVVYRKEDEDRNAELNKAGGHDALDRNTPSLPKQGEQEK